MFDATVMVGTLFIQIWYAVVGDSIDSLVDILFLIFTLVTIKYWGGLLVLCALVDLLIMAIVLVVSFVAILITALAG